MNRARAIKLLEMLRLRTEARGATPAEAAQAAELAEKLIKRYGIDERAGQTDGVASMQLECKVIPWWAKLLAFGIERRFQLQDGTYERRVGVRAVVTFRGEQHIASVAAWLFRAVANDLVTRATREARRHQLSGGDLVSFRNKFCQSAALEVYERLNPPTEQQRIAAQAELDASESRCSRRPPKPLSPIEMQAMMAGSEAGRDVSIATNAVGRAPTPLLSRGDV